jgi:hypothetical protein
MEDPNKLAVIEALSGFSKRANDIADRISDRHTIGMFEKIELQRLYKSLKDDIKDAADRGKVFVGPKKQSDWERFYFVPATMKAFNSLRAKSNTHPINSSWMGCLLDAQGEFSYYLFQLEKDHPEGQ